MKKFILGALTLAMLSGCSASSGDTTLTSSKSIDSTKAVPIGQGTYTTSDLIMEESEGDDQYTFGGFLDSNTLVIDYDYGHGFTSGYGQEYYYKFSKGSTFKISNGIILKVVDFNIQNNSITLQQLTREKANN